MQGIIFDILRGEKIERAKDVHIAAGTKGMHRAIGEYGRCDGYDK